MSAIEKNLWIGVYVATIGLLIGGDNSAASARAAYLASEAVDQFRAAFGLTN